MVTFDSPAMYPERPRHRFGATSRCPMLTLDAHKPSKCFVSTPHDYHLPAQAKTVQISNTRRNYTALECFALFHIYALHTRDTSCLVPILFLACECVCVCSTHAILAVRSDLLSTAAVGRGANLGTGALGYAPPAPLAPAQSSYITAACH